MIGLCAQPEKAGNRNYARFQAASRRPFSATLGATRPNGRLRTLFDQSDHSPSVSPRKITCFK